MGQLIYSFFNHQKIKMSSTLTLHFYRKLRLINSIGSTINYINSSHNYNIKRKIDVGHHAFYFLKCSTVKAFINPGVCLRHMKEQKLGLPPE